MVGVLASCIASHTLLLSHCQCLGPFLLDGAHAVFLHCTSVFFSINSSMRTVRFSIVRVCCYAL